MRKYNIIFLVVLLFIMAAGLVATSSYPQRARVFPMIVIGICIVLLSLELIKEILNARKSAPEGSAHNDVPPAQEANISQLQFIITITWIGGLAVMVWLLGYIVALPLYLLIYLRFHGQKWRWSILLSAVMFLIVYVGFNSLLKVPLYEGLIFLI